MPYSKQQLWQRFKKYYQEFPQLGLSLDISRVNFPDDFFAAMAPRFEKAFQQMKQLEAGGIANPDEKRMVGHYWLRNPALAPLPEIRNAIEETNRSIKSFARRVHDGSVRGATGSFKNLLLIGIGGSALGPQFVSKALGQTNRDKLQPYFFDNTDPDGIDNTVSHIGSDLGRTLCLVVSKSGGTKETRNGMLEAKAAYEREGLDFGQHAVAITSAQSELDKLAIQENWLTRFPMWDWVGGRTSELSAVGLLPAALQGFDIDSMLAGARACDDYTRSPNLAMNPSARLSAIWFVIGNGKGEKNMVVLPYNDRLELFSKYLQQLIMESLGKERDLDGRLVNQGITVLGNKGSTDQHSYVQQLRDGLDNFFVTFIRVLRNGDGRAILVEPDVTSGDYLDGFIQGTRRALYENGRQSVVITLAEVSPFAVGVLIALFERAVGYYASLININAYHQPGVESGKKAASTVIDLQRRVLKHLRENAAKALTAEAVAQTVGAADEAEVVFNICEHLAANPVHKVVRVAGESLFEATYKLL